jgi:hypothetical protein
VNLFGRVPKLRRKSIAFVALIATTFSFLVGTNFLAPELPAANAGTSGTPSVLHQFPAMNSTSWLPVRSSTGALLNDPNDQGTSDKELDLYANGATDSVADWYSDGAYTMFRLQLFGTAGSSNIANGNWVIALGKTVNGAPSTLAWVGVNGNGNGQNSSVFVYNPKTSVKTWTDATMSNAGIDTSPAWSTTSAGKYYLAFQVPTSQLAALGASAGFGFFIGTSRSNSLTTINRDYLNSLGSSPTPTYSNVQTVNVTTNVTTLPSPTLTSLSPTGGSTSGGSQVVITGTNLDNLAWVKFGASYAQILSYTSTTVTVLSPAGSIGPVTVQVSNTNNATASLTNAYTYTANLTATSLSFTAPATLTTGATATLSATVKNLGGSSTLAGATGVIVFKDTSTTPNTTLCTTPSLSSGTSSCSYIPISVAPVTITATYGGDATYSGSSSTANAITPAVGATSVVFTAPAAPTAGTVVALTATVYNSTGSVVLDSSTGSVTYSIGATTICTSSTSTTLNSASTRTSPGTYIMSAGVAPCDYYVLAGAQTITASYSGDNNFAASSFSSNTGAQVLSTPSITGTTPTSTSIAVAFSTVANATNYTIRVYDSSGLNVLSSATATTSPITVSSGLTASTSYFVTVQANGNGTSFTTSAESAQTAVSTLGTPSISPSSQTLSGTVNTAVTATTAFTATNFSGAVVYSVSPTLPLGLSINSATGVISGTPTTASASSTYTVTGNYSAAGQTATATVDITIVAIVPGAPTSVAGVAGNGQVVVSWTAPSSTGGSAITDYTVQYSSNGGSTWSTFTHTASASTSLTVTGLTNGTAYVFQVAAVNSVGAGSYSSASSSVTPLTVPGAPTSVAGVAGNGQVVVSWTAPSSTGGSAITDYTVQYSSNGGSTWSTFTHTASASTSLTVTGLTNGTAYVFQVAAVNAAGRGSYSSTSASVTPKSSDSTLSNLVSSASTLSPGFTSGNQTYTLVVTNSTSSITLTPTTTDAGATVKIGGISVTSGTASGSISLNVGTTVISVVVTAENGTTRTYSVTVSRPSNDATLTSLVASTGALNATFDPTVISYTQSVANSVSAVTVTAVVHETNATIKVNGVATSSGAASASISLAIGSNTIQVEVTAQDGTKITYTIVVTRAHADQAPLTISTLAATYGQNLNLNTSGGSGSGAVTYVVSSGNCTITSGVLTPTGAGACVVVATKAGDSTYNSISSASTTINIDKASRTISFTTAAYSLAYGAQQTLSIATHSGGGAITYYDGTSTACAVDSTTGVVTVTAASGTCEITAAIAADSNYYGATTSNTVIVTLSKANQAALGTITLNASEKAYPYSFSVSAVSATGGSGTGSLSVTSVASGTAQNCALAAGVLTADSSGTCTLTVTKAGDANYNAVTGTATFTFNKAIQANLVITSTTGVATQALVMTKTGGSGTGAVSYSTTTPNCSITLVNGNYELSLGTTTPTTCLVTVIKAADDNYQAAQTTSNVGLGTQVATLELALQYNANGASHNVRTKILATANTNGTVDFYAGGTLITNCSAIPTATAYVATCNWTPTTSTSGLVLTADFTPTSNAYSAASASTTINVTNGSLSGLDLVDLTNLYKTTTDGSTAPSFSTTTSRGQGLSTGVALDVPLGAFTSLTEINMYLYTGTAAHIATNRRFANYLLNVVVEWHAMDGSRPSAAHPLTLTISDPSIKAGMGLYTIVNGAADLQSVASQDGIATFSLVNDPGAVVAFIAPDAPTAVTAVAGNGQATISWTAPANNGGSAITSYTVTASNGNTCVANTGTPVATSCVITGLTNAVPYNFSVTATNGALLTSSASLSSADVTPAGTPDAPTSVTATAGNGQASVQWLAPTSNGGSAITNYIVEYSSNNGLSWTTAAHPVSTNTSLAVTGLANGATYIFRITAVNAVGSSTPSVSSSSVMPKSTDSTLSQLVSSSGTLSPTFAGGTLAYSISVGNSVTSITLTPTLSESHGSIQVNGTSVTSGQASSALSLSVGSNVVLVEVTAQDGFSTTSYTVTVTRAGSAVATLSGLTTSGGSISPGFTSNTSSYTVSVSNGTTSISITPTVTSPNATVTVNGVSATSGSSFGPINLSVGQNVITVVVTAQDGSTFSYTVTVTRGLSADSSLASLTSSAGTLSPTFTSGTSQYSLSVANNVTSLTLTPTVAESHATITVNGSGVASGSASPSIALATGSNTVTVVVTAQDGTTTTTYTLTITRAPSSVATLSALNLSIGTLSPVFSSSTTSYSVSLANAVSSFQITPYVTQQNATITVNGVASTPGASSSPISLSVGVNTITVVVTSQSGTATQTYVILVTRSAAVIQEPVREVPTSAPPVPLVPLAPVPFATPPAEQLALIALPAQSATTVNTVALKNESILVAGDSWSLKASVVTLEGAPARLSSNGRVTLEIGQYVLAEGSGFHKNATVNLYLFSTPVLVGVLTTDEFGVFNGSLPIPAGLAAGNHSLQLVGYSPDGTIRAITIPATVKPPVGKMLTTKLYFKADSSTVDQAATKGIKALAAKIGTSYKSLKVGVVGFVLLSDPKSASKSLSLRRAQNVVSALKQTGLKGTFVARGGGVAMEKNSSARRVEITITYLAKSR